jgi:hypothetical protein
MRAWGVDERLTEQVKRDEEYLAGLAKKAEQKVKSCIGCLRSKLGACKKHASVPEQQ